MPTTKPKANRVDNERTRSLIIEGQYQIAERYSRSAITTLMRRDDKFLLVETLILHAISLARLGKHTQARATLDKAIDLATTRTDINGACEARLTIIQELHQQTPFEEIVSLYKSTLAQLKQSTVPQVPIPIAQLIDSFAIIIDEAQAAVSSETSSLPPKEWDQFSLKDALRKRERDIIQRALRDSNGVVTKASRLLGFRHHQSLISIINSRHQDLISIRSVVRKRRTHLISTSRKSKTPAAKTKAASAATT